MLCPHNGILFNHEKEGLTRAALGTNLGNVMLSERSHTQSDNGV